MTRGEVEAKVVAVVGRTLDVDPADIARSTTAEDVDGWDSLAHATILIRLEKAFDVDLDRTAANEVADLGALVDLVEKSLHG